MDFEVSRCTRHGEMKKGDIFGRQCINYKQVVLVTANLAPGPMICILPSLSQNSILKLLLICA